MGLIYCKACGKQISDNAKSCPSCGEPQKRGNKIFYYLLIIAAIALIGFGLHSLYNGSPNTTVTTTNEAEQKKAVINEILGNDCTFISEASSEYIKNGMLSSVVNAIANNRCDCIKEVIVPKMMGKYTLKELNELKKQPLHAMQAIGIIISDNMDEIKNQCFRLR